MPLDYPLPPTLLPHLSDVDRVVRHFLESFRIRVDAEGLDTLPASDRLRLANARPPEPPEAVLLDRVLQVIPLRLLQGVDRILLLPARGVARYGGYLNGIVRVSASEADTRRPDPEYGNRVSVFTATVAHEIGHAIYATVLTAEQRDSVLESFIDEPKAPGRDDQLSEQGVQHHFINVLVPALLGYGIPPYSAAASRRAVAAFGLDLRRS